MLALSSALALAARRSRAGAAAASRASATRERSARGCDGLRFIVGCRRTRCRRARGSRSATRIVVRDRETRPADRERARGRSSPRAATARTPGTGSRTGPSSARTTRKLSFVTAGRVGESADPVPARLDRRRSRRVDWMQDACRAERDANPRHTDPMRHFYRTHLAPADVLDARRRVLRRARPRARGAAPRARARSPARSAR